MLLYSEGMALQAIAAEIGCAYNTIVGWKSANSPQDWMLYKEIAARERTEMAIADVRRRFAETLKSWQDNASNVTTAANFLLRKIIAELKKIEEQSKTTENDPKAKPQKIKPETVDMIFKLAKTFKIAQEQQLALFGLPNVRVSSGVASSPMSQAITDKDIDKMSERELLMLVLELNAGDENEK
jgi:hypothetical protein